MNREELFKSAQMDPAEMRTEELFRQTGRTFRMVAAAVKAEADGNRQVVIVMKDELTTRRINEIISQVSGNDTSVIKVVSYNPHTAEKNPIFDWKTFEGLGDYEGCVMFVDHDVIWSSHCHLFREASRWDPKVSFNGDAMTFVR